MKKVKKAKRKRGCDRSIRSLFENGDNYTIDELAELTNYNKSYVSYTLSRMQNPRLCGNRGPFSLIRKRRLDGSVVWCKEQKEGVNE